MKLSILAGATSQSVNVFIQDSTSTTGAGKTGLVFNSSGLAAYYSFSGVNAGSVAITLATLAAVNSAYSSGGFKEIDATNMPGWYRLDIPNAALASGKGRCVGIHLQGATGMAPLPLEIELTGWDNQDAVHGGMSALPNTACATNGSLITSGTGAAQLTTASGDVTIGTNNDKTGYGLSAAAVSSIWQDTTAGDFTVASSIGKSIMNGVSLGTGLTINGYTGNTPQTGDVYARIGVNGAGLTALGDARIANLDAAVSSRATTAAILTTALTESYAALHAAPTLSQMLFEIRGHMCEKSVAGTTLTINGINGVTAEETFTLNSSATPTAITRTT